MKNKVKGQLYMTFVIFFLSVLFTINIIAWFYPQSIVREDFENDFGGWTVDADVPQDPNNPGHPIEWHIIRTLDKSSSGLYSLEFFIDGKQDDGTIWIERKINVKENSRIQIKVAFQLYSEWESANAIAGVCAHVNTSNPEKENDFIDGRLGPANQVAGWKKYEYTTRITTDSTGEIWIGLGISVLWETHMTYYIDDLNVAIFYSYL